jgi:hypothetical protein
VGFSRMTGKRYEGIFIVEASCVKNWFELGEVWAEQIAGHFRIGEAASTWRQYSVTDAVRGKCG